MQLEATIQARNQIRAQQQAAAAGMGNQVSFFYTIVAEMFVWQRLARCLYYFLCFSFRPVSYAT